MATDRFESQETQDDIAYLGTPIVNSAGIPGSANVSIITSKYIKYGRLVIMSVYGKMLGNVSSATNLTICELPYAPDETLFPLGYAFPGTFALYRGSAVLGVGANFCRLVAKSNGKYYLGQTFSSNLVTDDIMTFDFSYIAAE